MKRSKKCFGLLLLLSIMVGLSLSVYSDDTSALKYEYKTLPIFQQYYLDPYTTSDQYSSPGFSIYWSSNNAPSDPLIPKQPVMNTNFNNNTCSYHNFGRVPLISNNEFSYGSRTYGNWSSNEFSNCISIYPYGEDLSHNSYFTASSIPNFVTDSIPTGGIGTSVADSQMLQRLKNDLPYSFDYSALYLHDNYTNDNGFEYETKLRMSALFGKIDGQPFIVNKFYRLTIPFDPLDRVGDLTQGRSVEFKGVFTFPNVDSSSGFSFAPDFISDGHFKLHLKYFKPHSSSNGEKEVSCSLTRTYIPGDEEIGSSMSLSYSCPYTFETDLTDYIVIPFIKIEAGPSGYVFDTTSDWGWSGAFVTTDGDDTPADHPASWGCQGGDCSQAPGSAEGASDRDEQGDVNYSGTLSNLFNFGFLNPFRPIFDLFSNQNTCAQIPIIAGMLHSQETQVCPWFPSTVRAIVTPVLGLSSMMLLFGFAVRWLGARSGNFFEDSSGGFDSGGLHIGRKGGKK